MHLSNTSWDTDSGEVIAGCVNWTDGTPLSYFNSNIEEDITLASVEGLDASEGHTETRDKLSCTLCLIVTGKSLIFNPPPPPPKKKKKKKKNPIY